MKTNGKNRKILCNFGEILFFGKRKGTLLFNPITGDDYIRVYRRQTDRKTDKLMDRETDRYLKKTSFPSARRSVK